MGIGYLIICSHCGRTVRKSNLKDRCPRCEDNSKTKLISLAFWVLVFIILIIILVC